jgi:hypothetical protein
MLFKVRELIGPMNEPSAIVIIVLFLGSYAVLWATGATSVKHFIDNVLAAYVFSWALYTFLSDLPRRELRRRFLLMTGSIALCTICLELPAMLGVLDYREVFSAQSSDLWTRPGYVVDPDLIWIRKPYSRETGIMAKGNIGEALCLEGHGAESFDLTYDRHGFRNDRDQDDADVVVIGDSYIESPMTQYSDLVTSQLSALQQRVVVNLGQLGYGPQQELAVLKRYALPLHPKTIIWAFFEGNDLTGARTYAQLTSMVRQRSSFDGFWERSFSKNVISSFVSIRNCVPHAEIQHHYGYVLDRAGLRHRMYFAMEEDGNIDPAGLLESRKVFESAYQLCRSNGIDFIVAFIPTKYRVYRHIADFTEASDAMKEWQTNDLPEQLQRMLARIDSTIRFIDSLMRFKKRRHKAC